MSSCVLLLFFAFACSGQAPLPQMPVRTVVPEHTSFVATLQHSINVAKVKVGDGVELRTEQSMLIGKGRVIQAGAKLLGKVIEASPITRQNRQARVSVLIERLEWHGGSIPLHAYIAGFLSRVISTDNALMRPGRGWSEEVMVSRELAPDTDPRFPHARSSVEASPASPFRSQAEFSDAARIADLSTPQMVISPDQFLKGVRVVLIREPSPGSVLVRDGKNFTVPRGMLVALEHSEVP